MSVTANMMSILHHTLGLRPDRRESYRNHFVAGNGHYAMPDLIALEQAGMMARARTPAFCNQDDIVFICTDYGKNYAIDHLPQEPKLTKYEEYHRSERVESFAEFIGINKPKYESRWVHGSGYEYRMFRLDRSVSWAAYPEIVGEWRKTKKSAKESYKDALAARKVRATS